MAKSNLTFKRNTTDKLTYVDEYEEEQTMEVSDLMHAFKGQEVTMSVALKTDEDLELIPTED